MIDSSGVDLALLVPPHWMDFDNGQAIECARQHPDRFAVVCRMDPVAPGAQETFESLAAEPGVVGFRFQFSSRVVNGSTHTHGREWLSDGRLRGGPMEWLFESAEASKLPLAFLLADVKPELAQLGEVASDHPNLPILVDHAAQGGGPTPFSRLPELVDLARFDNIYVKLSGLPPLQPDPANPSPFIALDPIVKRIVDAFGAGRCMWGSDMTKYAGKRTHSEVVDQFRVGTKFLSDEQRALIMGGAAARVYNLDLKKAPK